MWVKGPPTVGKSVLFPGSLGTSVGPVLAWCAQYTGGKEAALPCSHTPPPGMPAQAPSHICQGLCEMFSHQKNNGQPGATPMHGRPI